MAEGWYTQMCWKKDIQPVIVYFINIPYKNWGEIKTFLD